MKSKNQLRRTVHLLYSLASAIDPQAEISRDPLHSRFEVNRGVRVRSTIPNFAELMASALTSKGLVAQVNPLPRDTRPDLEVTIRTGGGMVELYPHQ